MIHIQRWLGWSVVASTLLATTAIAHESNSSGDAFRRIATFPVHLNSDITQTTSAEIVTSADNGRLLIYSDSELGVLGFIDIANPANPLPAGTIAMPGEPTSVTVRGRHALVCVNTSADYINTSGELLVVDVYTRTIVRSLPLGGQPDSIAISPNGRFGAVAIENERDEDLGEGVPPQLPAGFLVIVDFVGQPANWSTRTVSLVGVADLYPEDPEPEFVDINAANIAAVTLQENNHIVLVSLPTGQIIRDFSAGTVDLQRIDVEENDLIEQVGALTAVPREPDAVVWTSNWTLATANEGDLAGGSRGFTRWSAQGNVLWDAGNSVEHLVARIGHYPEDRSENKGNEPEGAEFARFGSRNLLFVGSERSNTVGVYQLANGGNHSTPQLRQILATGNGPEGLHAIPHRGLFVVACEVDDRGDKIRSSVMIYRYDDDANYPTIISSNREASTLPIPWAAMSGLAAHPSDDEQVYAIHDSFYRHTRIYTLDIDDEPAVIRRELALNDANGVLRSALDGLKLDLPNTPSFDPSALVEASGLVNLDAEGLATNSDGSFWIASEGTGNLANGVSNPLDRPFVAPNLLVKVASNGTILDAVLPPLEVTRNQFRFGYEGVAVDGQYVYVCFQRRWSGLGDPTNMVRIGRFDTVARTWGYAYYQLELPASPNGGWVGLSELTALGGGEFMLIERDDQGATDARIKYLTRISLAGVAFADHASTPALPMVAKSVQQDLLATGVYAPWAGLIPEKQEGLTVLCNGDLLLVNDNDGVDDNNGETLLVRISADR